MTTRRQNPSGILIATLMASMVSAVALLSIPASAQEVAPALRFAPQPGALNEKVPPVIVRKSHLEALRGEAGTTPATETTPSAAVTPAAPQAPIRIELDPAEPGSGSGGFQLRDVTTRKPGGTTRTLSPIERERAVQDVRRSLLSKTTDPKSAQ